MLAVGSNRSIAPQHAQQHSAAWANMMYNQRSASRLTGSPITAVSVPPRPTPDPNVKLQSEKSPTGKQPALPRTPAKTVTPVTPVVSQAGMPVFKHAQGSKPIDRSAEAVTGQPISMGVLSSPLHHVGMSHPYTTMPFGPPALHSHGAPLYGMQSPTPHYAVVPGFNAPLIHPGYPGPQPIYWSRMSPTIAIPPGPFSPENQPRQVVPNPRLVKHPYMAEQKPVLHGQTDDFQTAPNMAIAAGRPSCTDGRNTVSEPLSEQLNKNLLHRPLNIDEQVLFQNPYLQRELHNYILQSEGTTAAHRFMQTVQHFNRSHENIQSQPLLQPTLQQTDADRNDNHKHIQPKREIVSVQHRGIPTQHDYFPPVNTEPAGASDHSSKSPFSDRSRDTSSPRAPSGNGFPFNMQPGMGPAHTVSGVQPPNVDGFSNAFTTDHLKNPLNVSTKANTSVSEGETSRQSQSQRLSNRSDTREVHRRPAVLDEVELPHAVDNVVRFIEDSLDGHSSENELGNIHIGQHSTESMALFGAKPNPAVGGRQAPLYMRGNVGNTCGPQHDMSYAGVLRSQSSSIPVTGPGQAMYPTKQETVPQSPRIAMPIIGGSGTNAPQIPTKERPTQQLVTTSLLPPPSNPLTADTMQPDPLELLKNLNIKASPGTQALYQYFS